MRNHAAKVWLFGQIRKRMGQNDEKSDEWMENQLPNAKKKTKNLRISQNISNFAPQIGQVSVSEHV